MVVNDKNFVGDFSPFCFSSLAANPALEHQACIISVVQCDREDNEDGDDRDGRGDCAGCWLDHWWQEW